MEPTQRVYANHTQLRGAAFDVALDFGYQSGDEPAEILVRVAMSWEHAAAIASLLNEHLAEYQKTVGKLPDVQAVARRQQEELEASKEP